MADEAEKKPGFVLNKKKGDSNPVPKTRKVIKKSAPGNGKKRVVVSIKKSSSNGRDTSSAENSSQGNSSAVRGEKARFPNKEQRPWRNTTMELNTKRPNVKAGNLSGNRSRPGSRYSNSRNGGNFTSGTNTSGGYRSRNSNFTGAQARAGYQNREQRDGGRPGGSSGPSGNNYQGGGFRKPGTSNFRRGPQTGTSPRGGFGAKKQFPLQSPAIGNKGPGKKTHKNKKPVYNNRKEQEEFFDEEKLYAKKKAADAINAVPKQIDIMETISVADLAKKMNLKSSEIIGKLMKMGMMVTINQFIDSDTATLLASEYGCEVHLVSLYDETVIESEKGSETGIKTRPPIVTVMGHVDHGKTKTLDAIRHTNVVAGEAGGITQKIGAYSVTTPKGRITFLDTPGHEAFTMMRARGAQVTDIVVLVVAADDGVMPQTTEAINHAKDAKVPIIVAVNKIDKPEANPDRVKTQLAELGLTPEEWGGDTQYVNISALKGEGISDLLDAILLQAEMLELKAQWDCRAEGKIIESRVDQGRGVVSTVIVQRGTLHQGDPFVAGVFSGRVRAMFDDLGMRIDEAAPSTPVEVLGMDSMPNAGDPFQVTENEREARAISTKRQELKRFEDAKTIKKVTLDNLYQTIDANEVKELKVVIKADLQGSAEALKQSLEKLSTKDIRLVVIHYSAGAINESDVMLAAADENAVIIGFNVRPTPKAKLLADQEKVEIRKYTIIYTAVEEVKMAMEGMLKPDTKEEVTGTLEVRNTFRVPKVGVIAGCYATDGIIKRTSSVNIIRDGIVKCSCKVSSLKRFKDDIKEVKTGFECGVGLENWQDIQVGDQLEAFEFVEVKRKLGDSLIDQKAESEKREADRAAKRQAEETIQKEKDQEKIAARKAAGKAKKAREKAEKKTREGSEQ